MCACACVCVTFICDYHVQSHFECQSLRLLPLHQTLQFESYKSSGKILLSQSFTRGLLEQLDHAHTSLSVMLKSPYVGPHREEAAQWSLKLTSIADVLQKWVAVQELWQSLESVFSNEGSMKVGA